MKDSKNERNASEQFSPEELIRKLKSQLSGEPAAPAPARTPSPAPQEDVVVSLLDRTLKQAEEPETVSSVAVSESVPSEESSGNDSEMLVSADPEESSPLAASEAEDSAPEAEPEDEPKEEPKEEDAAAEEGPDPFLEQLRRSYQAEELSPSGDAAPAADEVRDEPLPAENPVFEETFASEPDDKDDKKEEDDFLSFIRAQAMQETDASAVKAEEPVSFDEPLRAEPAEHPDEDRPAETKVNLFAGLDDEGAAEVSVDESENTEKPTIAFDLGSDAEVNEPEPAAAESFSDNKPNINMLIALGISVSEVENIYGKEVAEEFAEAKAKEGQLEGDEIASEGAYEYTAASQNEEIARYFKKGKTLSLVKLIASAALLFLLFLYENLPLFGVSFTGWLSQPDFPLVHVMVDLQLVLIAAALAFEELIDGAAGLFKKAPDIRSFTLFAVTLNVIYSIVVACTPAAATARLSGFSAVFMITVCLLVSYLKIRADADNFAVVSTTGLKACCFADDDDSVAKEKAAFANELEDENPKVISFGNAHFVENFFSRVNEKTPTLADRILIPAALIALAALTVLAAVRSKDAAYTFSVFGTAVSAFFPVSVFAAGVMAFVKAQRLAHEAKSAIIGESAPYIYSGASVVTFQDKDVYPSYCVKLRNLKVYGNAEIEEVLRTTAVVFREAGGPLSDVFEYATSDLDKSERATIVRSGDSGIECEVAGKRVLVGKPEFLQSYGIIPYSDLDDREYLKTGDVGIMYVCLDNELCAKFYIQYTMDVDFENLLHALNKSGICVAIRTSDPNIDKHLLQAKLNLRRAALRIIHQTPDGTAGEAYSVADSGVVGNGSSNELVSTMLLCDRIVHVLRTNNILKCVSVFASILLLLLIVLFAPNLAFFSLWLVLYQLFWMIPTVIVSKLFL
ncbi:MAG: hypothetical protein II771_05360 [Clostridia bacterium]|nr:hypothetical protein [Clostridia bacterium]